MKSKTRLYLLGKSVGDSVGSIVGAEGDIVG